MPSRCTDCPYLATAYDGNFKWCNEYRCKPSVVKECRYDVAIPKT